MAARSDRRRTSAAPLTSPARRPLHGRVALVAGATRGAGRGIAWALGEAGATVYCTGRSVKGSPSPYGRPETIDETATLVTEAGGQGLPVRVDHTDPAQVGALMTRITRDHRRLDVLVCSNAGEDPSLPWSKRFTDLEPDAVLDTLRRVVVSHLDTIDRPFRCSARGPASSSR